MCCPGQVAGLGDGHVSPSLVCVVVRGLAGCGQGLGGGGQPDNKSPMRAMAFGGLFSASVGREGAA